MGTDGWTHPVRVLGRAGAVRRPAAGDAGTPGPRLESPRRLEVLVSGGSGLPVTLWSSSSVHSRHVQ